MYTGVHPCKRVYMVIHRCTRICRRLHGSTRKTGGFVQYFRVYKGHTGPPCAELPLAATGFSVLDIGSITILYSQPVAALQMLTSSGEWKWVRHLENALACLPLKLKENFHC